MIVVNNKKSLNYDISKFSAAITSRRKKLNLKQKELAQAVFRAELNAPNADASTLESKRKIINGYENSKSPKYPSNPETYCRLCEELDCDLDYLFGAISTPHRETTDIIEETGLSETAIGTLRNLTENEISFLNKLLGSRSDLYFIAAAFSDFKGKKAKNFAIDKGLIEDDFGPDTLCIKNDLDYARFTLVNRFILFADKDK